MSFIILLPLFIVSISCSPLPSECQTMDLKAKQAECLAVLSPMVNSTAGSDNTLPCEKSVKCLKEFQKCVPSMDTKVTDDLERACDFEVFLRKKFIKCLVILVKTKDTCTETYFDKLPATKEDEKCEFLEKYAKCTRAQIEEECEEEELNAFDEHVAKQEEYYECGDDE